MKEPNPTTGVSQWHAAWPLLRYRPRQRLEPHLSSYVIEPPTAHAVGILAITCFNHWLTPVVGLNRPM
jgi:hypothetical protein